MDLEINQEKKEAYKKLFGSGGIISRPDDSISWELFKGKYYTKENFFKTQLKSLKKSTSNLPGLPYSTYKTLDESLNHAENSLKEVIDYNLT